MLITSKHLEGACQDQIDLFNKTFPVGAEFNKTNWDLTLRVGLEVKWARRLLDESNRKIYNETIESAQKIYEKATTSAWEIYEESETSAWEIYEKEPTTLALKTFNEATESALKVYNEAAASDWKIYKEAVTYALFNALEQQFNGTK